MAIDTCKTGSFYIRSLKTGRLYLVEPIGNVRTGFGDSLDSFCNGSITEKQSKITEDRFINIGYAKNPMDYIDSLEQ